MGNDEILCVYAYVSAWRLEGPVATSEAVSPEGLGSDGDVRELQLPAACEEVFGGTYQENKV